MWSSVKALQMVDECCSPLVEAPLGRAEAEGVAAAFRVLGDPHRLRLLSLISSRPGGEACVCELVEPLGLKQPTVSHHLKVLHEAGLLERERRANFIYYKVSPGPLDTLRRLLATPAAETV